MNRLILIVVLSYFLVGFLVGLWWTFDIARDDLASGKLCDTFATCPFTSMFIIPASMLLWPLFLVDTIFVILAPVLIIIGLIWFVIRNRPVKGSKLV